MSDERMEVAFALFESSMPREEAHAFIDVVYEVKESMVEEVDIALNSQSISANRQKY